MSPEIIVYVLVPFVGLALGIAIAMLRPRPRPVQRDDLLTDARSERDERLRAARGRALEERAEAEALARQSLTATEEVEHRLTRRDERLEGRLDTATARESAVAVREREVAQRATAVQASYQQEVAALEQIRTLSSDVARASLLEQVAPSARAPAAARAEALLTEADQACLKARARPSALAVQRTSGELVGEYALISVPIPREEIKGRIIGREGRNIKAFEAMTGVELVIDDAPDVVTLSGFDPVRREAARLALLELVEDGRIHPGRIDEAVVHARDVLARQLREHGARAAEELDVGQIAGDLAELVGRLSLIRGDGEDALKAAVRRAGLAAVFAPEVKADARHARRAGLLRDLGKAVGREAGGSTQVITADVLARFGEAHQVIAAVRPPTELYPAVTPEQAAVWLADTVAEVGLIAREESPIRRVDAIERAIVLVEGVTEALAFQVGTRVRLLIRTREPLDTVGRILFARTVLERLDDSLGPRVGLTVAFLAAPGRRRASGDGAAAAGSGSASNGAARVEQERFSSRRHGRRGG